MDGAWEEVPEVVGELQAVAPGAAEALSEPLQGSTLHLNEAAEPGVGWASAWAAGACWVEEADQGGGDVVGVVHQGAFVAQGLLVGGPEDQKPYEAVRQEASVGAGLGGRAGWWGACSSVRLEALADLWGGFVLWGRLVSCEGGVEFAVC